MTLASTRPRTEAEALERRVMEDHWRADAPTGSLGWALRAADVARFEKQMAEKYGETTPTEGKDE